MARERLLQLLRERAYARGVFELAPGLTADYHLDCRLVTLDGEGLYLAASLMLQAIAGARVSAVGGLAVSAVPLAAGVAALSFLGPRPALRAFVVRKRLEGKQRMIEGPLSPGDRVAIVDDVITSGESVSRAVAEIERAGAIVGKIVALVDRGEGGVELLRARGYDAGALFALGELRPARGQVTPDAGG